MTTGFDIDPITAVALLLVISVLIVCLRFQYKNRPDDRKLSKEWRFELYGPGGYEQQEARKNHDHHYGM